MDQAQTVTSGHLSSGRHLDQIPGIGTAFWNLGSTQLVEHAVRNGEGEFAANGALVVRTGQYTGRSPKDKFIVRDGAPERTVQWGSVNQAMSTAHFDRLWQRMQAFWGGRTMYVQDCIAGADPNYALRVRVVSQLAWHSLF